MGGPFRSDSEHLREQLRRVDEEVQAVEEKRADLQRALALRDRRRPWVTASLVTVVLGIAAGYAVGYFDASREDARALADYHQTAFDAAAVEHVELLDCEQLKRVTTAQVAECRRDLGRRKR